MRLRPAVLGLAVLLALPACDRAGPSPVAGPEEARFAFDQDLSGTPDLIVDRLELAASWVIYEETFSSTSCSAIEGGFEGGTHRVLRFTVKTPNIGDADVFIGDPNSHIDPNGDGDTSDSDGLFELAPCHNHFHFRNYATYEIFPVLANGSLGKAIQARKRGFCMIDVDPFKSDIPPESFVYASCGRPGIPGFQGISTGWSDEYFKFLSGQFFLLTDPVEPILPGDYVIRITVNPPFKPRRAEVCPAKDPNGLCHMFAESDYANNAAEVQVTVPDRVGRTGFGPGGGSPPPSTEQIDDESRRRS
ncbi:MAG: hypothetical protein HY561_06635 [Gemmatimonadetes bacterium]|nr:hypothetical protein [Gemmatimonadota bacterium]